MALAPPSTILFDEILDFLASTPTPEQLINYEPPENLQHHLSDLLERNRQRLLSVEERDELDEFLRMDRFMSRLKRRARKNLVES